MEAFERLQQDLPADLAEGMRRSFSEHPDAGKAIGTNGLTVDIDEAFQQNFAKSTLYRRILKWDKEPTQRYKIAIVLRAVADRLGEMRRAGNLNRVNRTLRLNVGRLIKGNEDVAAPLMLTAHNLGIVPMPM